MPFPVRHSVHSVLQVGNFLTVHGRNRAFIEDLADRLELRGWSVYRTSNRIFRPARLISMIWDIIAWRKHYCIAHVTVFSGIAFIWAEVASWVLRKLRKPYILSLHGGNLPAYAHRWPGRVRRLLRGARDVVTPSAFLREELLPYCADLLVIPNSIELSSYTYVRRQKLRPELVWVRAFHRLYNPSLAPKVIALLADEFPDIHLYMIGPDKGDGSMQLTIQTAADCGVSKNIGFVGAVSKSEVTTWLNKGDIFLNTTNIDNTPVSVLEAMASGLCIVSTNVGGLPYLLDHGRDALLVPPDNPKAMAEAIRCILTVPDMAERISVNARRKVEGLSWETILPMWEKLLELENKEAQ